MILAPPLDPGGALTSTLLAVSDLMARAEHPWWLIGSAAVALHIGRNIDVRDVDIMLDPADAETIRQQLGIAFAAAEPHAQFRSEQYFTWNSNPLPVEFMAGFCVFAEDEWQEVQLATRQQLQSGPAVLYAPETHELAALLERFGRPKDRQRLALLAEAGFSV